GGARLGGSGLGGIVSRAHGEVLNHRQHPEVQTSRARKRPEFFDGPRVCPRAGHDTTVRLVDGVVDERAADACRHVVAATLLPRLRDLGEDVDLFDTRGLAGTPESLILRLQPAIYLGRDAIAEGPDVPRYPRPLCVAEHHGRIARESTGIESRIRPADVPNSSVEARVALRGPGRRSTGGLFESARSISDRARRGPGRRSAALKHHQKGDG